MTTITTIKMTHFLQKFLTPGKRKVVFSFCSEKKAIEKRPFVQILGEFQKRPFEHKCTYLRHHEVPREGNCIPLRFVGVVFSYRVQEKFLSLFFGIRSVENGQDDGSDLKQCDNYNKKTVGS